MKLKPNWTIFKFLTNFDKKHLVHGPNGPVKLERIPKNIHFFTNFDGIIVGLTPITPIVRRSGGRVVDETFDVSIAGLDMRRCIFGAVAGRFKLAFVDTLDALTSFETTFCRKFIPDIVRRTEEILDKAAPRSIGFLLIPVVFTRLAVDDVTGPILPLILARRTTAAPFDTVRSS